MHSDCMISRDGLTRSVFPSRELEELLDVGDFARHGGFGGEVEWMVD